MKLFNFFLASSILASGLLSTELKRSMKVVPMEPKYLSTEYGGVNHASAALSDGVGIYSTQNDEYAKAISYLNSKYGEDALKNEQSLKDYVLEKGETKDKKVAEKLNLNKETQKSTIGDFCDDGDIATMNDMYIDDAFTCVGKIIIGSECDDENESTTMDIYIDNNFTCKGQKSVINAPCDDGITITTNDKYIDENFTCKGSRVYDSIKCYGDSIGSSFTASDGKNYLVVSNSTIKTNLNRANTLCTSNVTDMSALFKNNTTINVNISTWDTSNVTSMKEMFYYAKAFNTNIGNWDVSNVKNMGYMFLGAEKFNQPLTNWDVSNVVDMSNMFSGATAFNQPIENWDVSKVTGMSWMFNYASGFNRDLSKWCVTNIKTKPIDFDKSSGFLNQIIKHPVWGTCPTK